MYLKMCLQNKKPLYVVFDEFNINHIWVLLVEHENEIKRILREMYKLEQEWFGHKGDVDCLKRLQQIENIFGEVNTTEKKSKTGNWNTGNWNTGSLNTKKPKYTLLFDKQILMSKYEKIKFPNYFYFDILLDDENLHKSWKKSFESASKKDVEDTLKLPNFNYKTFEKITGISKKMIMEKLR